MELRPYQKEAKEAVFEQWENGTRKTLLVLPTGCGKTIVFAKITEECVSHGDRVLILAHRGELLEQAADKIARATGLKCATEKAEESCLGSWYRITVGSVQSLMRTTRLSRFPEDYFNTIIIDEAHHCISDSYQRVLKHFSDAKVLGVTATPDRGDMKNLGQVFESLAYEYTLPKAIKEGYLSPIKAVTIPLQVDLTGVGVQSGDFKAGDLGTALDPYLESIAAEMEKYCQKKKTVVFLPLVKTSQKFRDILNAHGFRAAEVNGESQNRAEILEDYATGKYNVLCNSMLLTEGWDCPDVDCIVVLRPTKVRSLYCQMVGRGTRLAPGKDHLLLLDFLWHTERHELCHPAHLICESEEVAQKMTENLEKDAGCPVDIEEAEKTASEDVVAQREEALAQKLAEMKRRKRKLVDPLQCININCREVFNNSTEFLCCLDRFYPIRIGESEEIFQLSDYNCNSNSGSESGCDRKWDEFDQTSEMAQSHQNQKDTGEDCCNDKSIHSVFGNNAGDDCCECSRWSGNLYTASAKCRDDKSGNDRSEDTSFRS